MDCTEYAEPLYQTYQPFRFWHQPTQTLFTKIVKLDLLNNTITVDKQDEEDEGFAVFNIEEGILERNAFVADMNENFLYEGDIVAIFFTVKVTGRLGDTNWTPQKLSDIIKHPQKSYNYFVSPVFFAHGNFCFLNDILNVIVPLSQIHPGLIEKIGNRHENEYLIPEKLKPQQKP